MIVFPAGLWYMSAAGTACNIIRGVPPMKSVGPKSKKKPGVAAQKKAAPKKSSPAKRIPAQPKQKSLEAQLRNEIRAMTLTLGAESLKKLLQDAAILAHNERVLSDYSAGGGGRAATRGRSVLAEVEEGRDGTYFIVILNSYRNFLSLDEMRKLITLCHSAGDARDAKNRLYAWIERDRRDIRKNSKVFDPDDPSLIALWEKVVREYELQ